MLLVFLSRIWRLVAQSKVQADLGCPTGMRHYTAPRPQVPLPVPTQPFTILPCSVWHAASLYCAGANQDGRLGIGSVSGGPTSTLVAAVLPTLNPPLLIARVALGADFMCFSNYQSQVFCKFQKPPCWFIAVWSCRRDARASYSFPLSLPFFSNPVALT